MCHTELTVVVNSLGMPVYSGNFSKICRPFWCKMCGKLFVIWRDALKYNSYQSCMCCAAGIRMMESCGIAVLSRSVLIVTSLKRCRDLTICWLVIWMWHVHGNVVSCWLQSSWFFVKFIRYVDLSSASTSSDKVFVSIDEKLATWATNGIPCHVHAAPQNLSLILLRHLLLTAE